MISPGEALVTGASAGIGAVYAERLAELGHDLVLVARRKDRLEQLAQALTSKHGVKAEVLAADLTVSAELARVEARLASGSRWSVVVNNAGFGGYRKFWELDPAVADQLIDVHIRAAVRLCRAALPSMVARGQGAVVNVASLLALSGTLPTGQLPERAVYAGAKAFLLAFTQALAGELKGTGVQAQVVLPGIVETEFHAVQGMGKWPFPVMQPRGIVDGSIAALERAEAVCIPTLEQPELFDAVGQAQRAVMQAAGGPKLAARYQRKP